MDVYLPKPSRHYTPPVNTAKRAPQRREPPPVQGNVFAILDNGWDVMPELTAAITARLQTLGAKEVLTIPVFAGGPVEDQFLDEIASKVAGAVTGLGN